MNHIAGLGLLYGDAVDNGDLMQSLHGIAVEFLGHDPGAVGCEGVVAFANEPVRAYAVAAGWATAAIRDVHGNHVAEDVIIGAVGGNILAGLAKDDGHFDLVLYLVAAVGHDDVFTVADNRAAGWLEEKVGYAAILLALFGAASEFVVVAAFAGVCVEIHRRIHDFAGVLNRRHDVHGVDIVHKVTARAAA